MSWDQSYQVQPVVSLLEKELGVTARQALEGLLKMKGLTIDVQPIQLTCDMAGGPIMGEVVSFSDGRTFKQVLVRDETWNGSEGVEVYEFRNAAEPAPKVERMNDGELVK